MIRVKDPKKSIEFYTGVLGMKQLDMLKHEHIGFDLYFLGFDDPASVQQGRHRTDREGVLELTHNYGTENDPNFKYHNGNEEPKGFGHICISVDDLKAACKKFEESGYTFKKKLTDGRTKNVAFLLDPDGYWIEIIQNEKYKKKTDGN